jgi:hypothetical protein
MVASVALAPRAPHPAVRRRVPARLPAIDPHDVVLRPYGGGQPTSMIVTAREADFIGAVLDDLSAPDADQRLAERRGRRRGKDGVLELHLPMHRRFHLVLLEASCRTPGSPRLDPTKLDGMGVVLRRVDTAGWAGWMRDSSRRKGWLSLHGDSLDPDPALRPQPRNPAARQIVQLIAARRGDTPFVEDTVGLFAAPPDLCAKLGRTILYGLVPVASGEESDVAPPAPDYANLAPAEAALFRGHLSGYLKQRPRLEMPRAGETLDPAWRPLDSNPADENSADGRLKAFAAFLQQLLAELGAFEEESTGQALRAALDTIALPMQQDARGRTTRTMRAGDFADAAARILVAGEPNSTSLAMPLAWPAIDAAKGAQLTGLAMACLPARFAALAPPAPKFDRPAAQYAVRAFIRVRGHDDCPPKLVWSEYSENFRILPWWESDGPATRITLPDISDLKNIKPSFAVQMPPAIANLLKGDAKKLADGEGSTGGLDIAWICSFSIPAITICAFIVLSIFLSLLNLIFGWMAWIKICIPIPKPK